MMAPPQRLTSLGRRSPHGGRFFVGPEALTWYALGMYHVHYPLSD